MTDEFIQANQLKPKPCMIMLTPQDELMVEALKPFAKTKARTKVFKFALVKTYEIYKNVKP